MNEEPQSYDNVEPSEISESQFTPPTIPPKYQRKRKTKYIAAVVILLLAGAGGWYFLQSRSPKPTTNTQPPQQTAETTNETDKAELKTYKSDILSVEFEHPADWTVTEKDKGLRIESPTIDYTSEQGPTSGKFRIYMRQGSRTVDGKYIGQGIVIGPSEKLVYAEPTIGQRKETKLTLFGFGDSSNFAYFLITSNYDLKKDDRLAPNFAQEADAFLIAGGFSKPDLAEDLNFVRMPLDSISNDVYQQAIDVLKSLKVF